MVRFFKLIETLDHHEDRAPEDQNSKHTWLELAFASHPANEVSIAFFRLYSRFVLIGSL